MNQVKFDRWTLYTAIAATVGALASMPLTIYVLFRPVSWFSVAIGAVIGVVIVQVIHKRRDPFA